MVKHNKDLNHRDLWGLLKNHRDLRGLRKNHKDLKVLTLGLTGALAEPLSLEHMTLSGGLATLSSWIA